MSKLKVALGLSGGVDSAVSAYILKNKGYDVTGVYIQCWDQKGDGCKAEEDRSDAARVAAELEIKFIALDFRAEYKEKVLQYFFDEYNNGRTPNPDVMCNKEIKFGLFYEWALRNGYAFVATGHYARIIKINGRYKLCTAVDSTKTQEYFLSLLNYSQLSKILFPLGEMTKEEVRATARRQNLHISDKPDSTGICFIGDINVKSFLKEHIKPKEGYVFDMDGKQIGTHEGVWFYTIGQRHGFNIKSYTGKPVYVVDKNTETNSLIVGSYSDACRNEFDIQDFHFIDPENVIDKSDESLNIRIRHLGDKHKINKISKISEGYHVELYDAVFGVAPGQNGVIYCKDVVVGGGTIS